MIIDNGKIIATLPVSNQRDEIGDLSRSFADVLSRLQQYNSYLENMASRLSHELRTPIAVVKSSLDMLTQVNDADQQAVFVERAQSGVNRLSTILNSMSEATRLEQAIQQEDLEPFDLVKVISGCIAGYEHAYSHRRFSFTHNADTARILGSPELTAQMFDKVIANAVDFSEKESEIQVSITVKDKQAELTISNTGPLLPEGMRSQLLQSMVSVRKENDVQNASSFPLRYALAH